MAEKANIDELRKILGYFSKGYKFPKIIEDVIFEVGVREVEEKGKVVLIKRDPNIERGRIQAVHVKVIKDNTMEMHPATVGKFGADFDGDTMGVYAPISEEAQKEAREKMITTVSNTTINDPMFEISKEALTGLYTITSTDNKNQPVIIKEFSEAVNLHPGTIIKMNFRGKLRTTTAGRIIFNAALPEWVEFVEENVGNKQLKKVFSYIISKDKEEFKQCIDRVMKLGFEMCTVYPRSISLEMLEIPAYIKDLNKDLKNEKDPIKQSTIIDKMTELLGEHLKNNVPHLYEQIKSGAAKGVDQMRQIMVAKGLITDPDGNILPVVAKSMNDGYTPDEYFNASQASRKGVADRALSTADGGYAYRKMVYVMANTTCNPTNMDCGTRRTLSIKLTKEYFKRMPGRKCVVGKKIVPVTEDMIGKVINLRSPIFCRSEKICRRCYGELIQQINTEHCGIVAAQECTSLSEKIMKCSVGLVESNDRYLYSFEDLFNYDDISYIKSKDDYINIISKEKHFPTCDMVLIKLSNGYTLFCQKNHPLFVNRNNKIIEIDNASDIIVGKDKICVDNSVIFGRNISLLKYSPTEVYEYLQALCLNEEFVSNHFRDIFGLFNGDNIYNIRFKPDFLDKIDVTWAGEFIDSFVNNIFYTSSYNLVQQLILLSSLCGINADVNLSDSNYMFEVKFIYNYPFYNTLYYKNYYEIIDVQQTDKWKDYVYDVRTETSEYMLGCVQNHNSFHTGGIVSLNIPNMIPMLTENVEDSFIPSVAKLFKQDEFKLLADTTPVIMRIDSSIYQGNYSIDKEINNEDEMNLPVGHFDLEAGGLTLPLTIEKPTKVFVTDKEVNEGIVVITYGKGDAIFELNAHTLTPQETARMIDQYIGGKSPWKDPSALLTKFFKLLSPYGGWDMVHLEVIISAMLRNRKNPQYPARVVHPYDPVTFSIKKLPGVMSWPLGLAFENFGTALTRGLISDRAPESSIEKVLFGEPLSDLGQEAKKKRKK